MNSQQVLNDNYHAQNNSFLYYLHEENRFHEETLLDLCESISSLTSSQNNVVSAQISFVHSQILKHIIYHFDPNDLSQIYDLPDDWNEKIELLDSTVTQYFRAASSQS